MTCPHCSASVRRQNRTGRVCGGCGRRFALEPLETPGRLTDVRVRQIALRLVHDAGLWFTAEQLWYATQRSLGGTPRTSRRPLTRRQRLRKIGELLLWPLSAAALAAGMIAVDLYVHPVASLQKVAWIGPILAALVGWVLGCALLLLVVGFLMSSSEARTELKKVRRSAPDDFYRIKPSFTLDVFEREVLAPWRSVHGPLPGLIGSTPEPDHCPEPVLTLVCASPAVRACLAANRVGTRLLVAVVDSLDKAPSGRAVGVLHDVGGRAFLAAAAGVDAPWVLDFTPPPHALDRSWWPRWLRDDRPPVTVYADLAALPWLTPEDVGILAGGWYCPLDAAPPAQLIAWVNTARRHARDLDADYRRAEAVGFLTWAP